MPTGVDEYVRKLDQFTSIYEETSHVIEGRTGEEHSFEERAAAEAPVEANAGDVDAFEAEVERLLAQVSGDAARGKRAGRSRRLCPVEPFIARASARARGTGARRARRQSRQRPRQRLQKRRRSIKRFASTSNGSTRC